MPQGDLNNITAPLYETLMRVVAVWTLANAGYFFIFPLVGLSLSYNLSSYEIAAYYGAWFFFSVWLFWDLFKRWLNADRHIWFYAGMCLLFAALVWLALRTLFLLPALQGPLLAPYSDLVFVTPGYFVAKAMEILVQQTLIVALILALQARYHALDAIVASYAVTFGGAHFVYYALIAAPISYGALMTAGAFFSALAFPLLILRVRNGFVYTYMIHLTFYIMVALALHLWPPPQYVFTL